MIFKLVIDIACWHESLVLMVRLGRPSHIDYYSAEGRRGGWFTTSAVDRGRRYKIVAIDG